MKHALPQAWTAATDGISGYGWAVPLLPFLEESALRQSINERAPISSHQNDKGRNTTLPIMLCPSDISDQTFDLYIEARSPQASQRGMVSQDTTPGGSPLVRLPAANYLGVFGTLEADETYPAPLGDGAVIIGRRVRFRDLERGQSHTLIIGERTTARAPSTWFGVHFHGEDAACRLVGAAVTTPNCDLCDECEFASRHSGGANFVWADGHVNLVEDDISPEEYQRLAKRRMD
jgi:prepilin-type processing-associated H-X9-DG protein